MSKDSTVLQLRLSEALKTEFTEAAEREHTTPSVAMRTLIEDFVRQSRRREAQRQSRLVAAATDAEQTMDDVTYVQDGIRDP